MTPNNIVSPDYLFETSWEVCNKVGGIHTVIATKSDYLKNSFSGKYITIGPDVWRNTDKNPEFDEDPLLYRGWRERASEQGLRLKVGRWNIPGEPIAILVDFTTLIPKKDEIFTSLWTKFGVDSLNGNWDYVDAALFGYAAGMVIESFLKFNARGQEKVVVSFHEWMSGAGLLYLRQCSFPVGTVFTTHSTVMGRCIAGRNMPLYDKLEQYDADALSKEFGVSARHSLEKASALNADVFTTVSDITASECLQFLGRKVDVVTPNGFENSFIPVGVDYENCRKDARARLLEVASAMAGESFREDSLLVGISGRHEYSNKGFDVFVDALGKLNAGDCDTRRILAFIMVPSNNDGPDKELQAKLSGSLSSYTTYTSHIISDDNDQVVRRLRQLNLRNDRSDRVQVFLVPTYLNGGDGIFNKSYYELLLGFDTMVFPSYYEPWGYTPLESLAFGVPAVTTSLSGFSLWANSHWPAFKPLSGLTVIGRNDSNYDEVVGSVADYISSFASLNPEQVAVLREGAREVSKVALWDNVIAFHDRASTLAIEKKSTLLGNYHPEQSGELKHFKKIKVGQPVWSSVIVNRELPTSLKPLEEISMNLWWCWNQNAIDLFESIDSDLWASTRHNPLAMLDRITYGRFRTMASNASFLRRLQAVYDSFSDYMSGKSERKGPAISYFCMEYGLDASLKIYSGGLGILAGDYLKEASDMQVNLTAVGLLYRYGYFTQKLTSEGSQISDYEPQDFTRIPATPVRDAEGKWLSISVEYPGRNINARVWRVDVGRTELYLLDTDYEDNRPEDRSVTHQLYGGDWENRLKQEMLLGIGGIRLIRALGIHTDVYHCNEGHAAFTGIERLSELVTEHHLSFSESLEIVRASSLFTTHTPVPAGHDAFPEDMLRVYLSHYPARLHIDWFSFMTLGRINPEDSNEKFSMSFLAANLSQEVNGVSWLHGEVSKKIFAGMWPGYLPEELNVSYVTNGVHYDTWTAPEWKEIHREVFGDRFASHHYDKSCFDGIYRVGNNVIWSTRQKLRSRLVNVVKDTIRDTSATGHYSPREIVKICDTLRDDVLTIGFARRFATYKRATLLFSNLERLNQIVNNPLRPVQFLFAGKAHPADAAGQDLIRRIVEISKMPQFIGKIVFVPDYDINIAKLLVQGVDVWMNNPTRPLEASGTSGEKAVMNGVMHFSVLDGWWVEGYKKGAGWALPMERTYQDQRFQDELDSSTIYNILENEIAPLFYDRDKDGVSAGWIQTIKNTVAQVACNFTTNRMMSDYLEKFYIPLKKRSDLVCADGFAKAREISFWKKRVRREWERIDVVSYTRPLNSGMQLKLGEPYTATIKLSIAALDPQDIGVEMIVSEQNSKGEYKIRVICPFEFVSLDGDVATYRCDALPDMSGMFQTATRIYAKNPDLPHRQDFEIVKWL